MPQFIEFRFVRENPKAFKSIVVNPGMFTEPTTYELGASRIGLPDDTHAYVCESVPSWWHEAHGPLFRHFKVRASDDRMSVVDAINQGIPLIVVPEEPMRASRWI